MAGARGGPVAGYQAGRAVVCFCAHGQPSLHALAASVDRECHSLIPGRFGPNFADTSEYAENPDRALACGFYYLLDSSGATSFRFALADACLAPFYRTDVLVCGLPHELSALVYL